MRMEQVLINQKSLKQRKAIKQNRKFALRSYGRDHRAIIKARLGKFVSLEEQKNEFVEENHIMSPTVSLEELIFLLRKSQLTGMSGNKFSTVQKIESFIHSDSHQRVLIMNGVECEPGLIHDEWLLQQHMDEINSGISILCNLLKINKVILAVKKDIQAQSTKIEIRRVPARYPMGEEHILLRQLFGIEIAKEIPPTDFGYLVFNVQTVYQIYHLCNGTYQNGRFVTIADIDTGEAKIIYAKKNDNIQSVLYQNFGNRGEEICYAGGGILSAYPVSKKECFMNHISFACVGRAAHISNGISCKKCGRCSRMCPMGVSVKEIVSRREADPKANISNLGLEKCIHCNSCTYFCRAGKNIIEYLQQ